ncbi:PAS domain-containing protein [Adhaeribacter radiodurans]|uniref:histidine kinase n=1 Tax=Adhaeribacter radiodurans TaxID=2745197 RepID=A0A7L7L341_9BACT|nr:PAS domain-containing protein [Adhaeribacter radiodurans]QMU27216.1 PAS domain-containing protein [Adhaeribacter radiodurans]
MDFLELFIHLPDAMVVLSPEPDFKIITCNNTYQQVTMRKREEIIGLPFLLEAFPDREVSYEQNPVRKSLAKAVATKQVDYLDVLRYDLPKPETEGGGFEVRYWEASHTPVLDETGAVKYVIQKTTDVTSRELAKQAQRESENKFRFMADAMPQLVFTTDPAGKLTYLNQRWAVYSNISLKELSTTGWQQIIHPEDLPELQKRGKEAFENKTEMQIELRKRDKEGSYRWHLCRMLPMRGEDGNITMWLGSSTDIHDTRLLVQELLTTNEQMALLADQVQLAYQKVELERKTLERFIMEAPAFFCILEGPEHRYELVNSHYQKLFPNRQLLHKPVAEALPEVIEQGFLQLLDNVYQTGKSYEAKEILVKLDQHNTGKLDDVYVNFLYQPILDETEKVTGILVFGFEINEIIKLRKQLQESGHSVNEAAR